MFRAVNPKCCVVVLSIFFLLSIGCPSQIYAFEFGKSPANKLARGFTYVVTSFFQIPKEMIQITAETEPVYLAPWKGFSVGLGTGLFHFGRQLVAGFWDIFTFWTPSGRDWAPLYEPATLFPEI